MKKLNIISNKYYSDYDYNNLMRELIKIRDEEKKIHTYPTMDTVILKFEAVNKAKSKKQIQDSTFNFDHYLKVGVKEDFKRMLGVSDVLTKVYDFVMKKRMSTYPKYDLKVIDDDIKYFEDILNEMKQKRGVSLDSISAMKSAISRFEDIKNILKKPWIVGLHEESQFSTIGKEINYELSLIQRDIKNAYVYKAAERFKEMREDIKKLLKG